ncbi:HOG (high osmolarity glycerol) pathway protein [Linnemannia elongata]|nr:HOG (high osmolarity glycerol) pathway protein [Linnemannia elongata]
MAPVSLPSSCQQRGTEVDLVTDNCPPSIILARKRASVHIIEGSTSAKRISLLFKNSRCRSFSESWAFLSASSGVSPIDEREGLNNNNSSNGSSNIADNNNSPSLPSSTLRLSPLRPADSDIDIDCDSTTSSPTLSAISTSSSSATASTKTAEPSSITATTPATTEPAETTSSSLSELPPSSLNLFRQPAVTGATAYEDLPDQELLKTLAAFLRGDSSPSHKKGNRPSAATTSSSNQDKDESEMCDLAVTVRDFAYPKTHPYHTGNYPPEPEYEESDIEEDEEEEYAEETINSSIPTSDEQDKTEGYARGLYDFDAENSSELSFKEGEFVWIHCRQFPGWFLGEKDGAQGLVPENYVQLV